MKEKRRQFVHVDRLILWRLTGVEQPDPQMYFGSWGRVARLGCIHITISGVCLSLVCYLLFCYPFAVSIGPGSSRTSGISPLSLEACFLSALPNARQAVRLLALVVAADV